MEKLKIAIIGFGNRGRLYGSFIKDNLDSIEVVAIIDNRIDYLKESSSFLSPTYLFSNAEDFFKAKLKLDLVFICSLDETHFAYCKQALLLNYNVLLEKPISSKINEVLELNKLANERNLKVVVSYVLRYTYFYRLIKKVIDDGEIGKVININTTENVSYWHYAHSYLRGNWKDVSSSGPMILTKCSHDLDLLYWLTNAKPKAITSFGGRNFDEDVPSGTGEYCSHCNIASGCAYNCFRFYLNHKEWLRPIIGDDLSEKHINEYLEKSRFSRCVYKTNSDTVDHQILNIEFEGGITASHTMNAYTLDCYRDIKVMGTKGCIEGNFEERKFKVSNFLTNSSKIIDINNYTDDFVGHGGGDRILFNELINYIKTGVKASSLTSISESVISHTLCFAAEESRLNKGKVIYFDE